MTEQKKNRQVVMAVIIGLTSASVIQILAAAFLYPDMSGDYPLYSPESVLIGQFAGVLTLISLTIMGMRAEEEREILAAAGFTSLAIGMGVALAGWMEIIGVNDEESYLNYTYISICSYFIFTPAMVLIATYSKFKMWIRIMGIVVAMPFLITTVVFLLGSRDYAMLETLANTGFLLLMLLYITWSVNIFINYKRDADSVDYDR